MKAAVINKLKPLPKLDKAIRDLFPDKRMYYKRKGNYAECLCGECGEKYVIRTNETGDIFQDTALAIEKPKRDEKTKCRRCNAIVFYKPIGHTADVTHTERLVVGQKISDERFVFRVIYAWQYNRTGYQTVYDFYEEKRIFCEKGKKPTRIANYGYNHQDGPWQNTTAGDNYCYHVLSTTTGQIHNTKMFKYIPVSEMISEKYRSNEKLNATFTFKIGL